MLFLHHHLHSVAPLPPQFDATHGLEQANSCTPRDPLQIPTGPITRARARRIKEALNKLVQDTLAKQDSLQPVHSTNQVFNIIWAEIGAFDGILDQNTTN